MDLRFLGRPGQPVTGLHPPHHATLEQLRTAFLRTPDAHLLFDVANVGRRSAYAVSAYAVSTYTPRARRRAAWPVLWHRAG